MADFFLSPLAEFVGLINQLVTVVVELEWEDFCEEFWLMSEKLSCFSCKCRNVKVFILVVELINIRFLSYDKIYLKIKQIKKVIQL